MASRKAIRTSSTSISSTTVICWTALGEWASYGQRDRTDSPLQLLARLQHFGAATGLLDFTYSPLVALWFACKDPSRDGKVFFVSHEPPNTTFVTPELEGQEIGNTLSRNRDPTGPQYMLWEPLVEGDAALRILGQRSVFVIGRRGRRRHVYRRARDRGGRQGAASR